MREVTLVADVRELTLNPPRAPDLSPEHVAPENVVGDARPDEHRLHAVVGERSPSESTTESPNPRRRRRIILLTLAALVVGGAAVTALTLSQREGSPPAHYLEVIRF